MKKSLLALAAMTAFAGGAMAQSSVTLFGIVDLGARYVDNDNSKGAVTSLTKDGNASSRLGFRGVEDLGGGLKAGFWLEAAVTADDGTIGGSVGSTGITVTPSAAAPTDPTKATVALTSTSSMFNRRATVSLMGNWGEIRLGRDYVPTFWNHTVFDPFGTNGVGDGSTTFGQAGVLSNTFVRANNTIGYFLPAMGGLYGQAMLALGEGNTVGNSYYGARIGYGAGPFNAALAYGVTKQTSQVVKFNGVDTSFGMPDDTTDWNLGLSYNAGFLTGMLIYRESEQGSAKNTGYEIGVTVPLGAGTVKAAYSETKWKSATASPKSNKLALGYVYDLSKRTAMYVHGAQIDNDAGLTKLIAGGSAPSASGGKSVGYEVGVRHSF